MGTLENRIKSIENKLLVDDDEQPEGIFCYVVDARKDAPPPEPVKGWKYNDHLIMRMEGEADKALEARAIAQVKPSLGKNVVPVFYSINEFSE